MMNQLVDPKLSYLVLHPTELDKDWMWKDREGHYHHPASMSTQHLFMTLVMIWNVTLPKDFRIEQSGRWKHHLYRLGPYYSVPYLKQGVRRIIDELSRRQDMDPSWDVTLRRMANMILLNKLEDLSK